MKNVEVHWKVRLRDFAVMAIASGGGTGYFPVASGTAGTLVGVLIVWLFRDAPLGFNLALILFLGGVGVWVSQEAGRLLKVSDSSKIVIDEIVGFMITMIGIPGSGYWLVFGFLLFRFFDITKLPPANYFDERIKNGWGVMLDDVAAGVYANILLQLMLRANI